MIVLICLIFEVFGINKYCWDSECLNCTDYKFNYEKTNCLDVCPTHFYQNQSHFKCDANKFDKILFLVEFSKALNYYQSEINGFAHPQGVSFKTNQNGPTPSKDRGFYFTNTSQLIAKTKPVLAPNFGLGIVLRIISPGTIFMIKNGTETIFEIEADYNSMNFKFWICNSTACYFQTISHPYKDYWVQISLNSHQAKDKLQIVINSVKHEFSSEFNPSSNNNIYSFGKENNEFTGFIYYFIIMNGKASVSFNLNLNNCTGTQYYYQGTCLECPSNSIWPPCAFENGIACYSINCTSCTGYAYEDCYNCKNSVDPPCILAKNCNTGNRFNCTKCENTFHNSNGVCILEPFPNFNPQKSIYLDFGSYIQNNPYFDWPENFKISDGNETSPTPMRMRGHYFNGIGYLQSKQKIYLNHSFTIAFWIFRMNDNPFYGSKNLEINPLGFITIELSNREESRIGLTGDFLYNDYKWSFFAFSVKLEVSKTTVFRYSDANLKDVYSIDGYAFYDSLGDVVIGCNLLKEKCFEGYIYSMDLWQYDFTFNRGNITFACPDNTTTCLVTCTQNQYFNIWENLCLSCDQNCNYGCASWASCRKCTETTCVSCYQNYTGVCLVNTPTDGSCASGLFLKQQTCCDSECDDCYGPYFFKCLRCASPSYLYDYTCVEKCPTGYHHNTSNHCVQMNTIIFSFYFVNIHSPTLDKFSNEAAIFGSDGQNITGNNETHPKPAYFRGYYFKNSSFVTGPELILPIRSIFSFYIKVEMPGLVFSIGNLKWFSNGTIFYQLRRFVNAYEQFNKTFKISNLNNWIAFTLLFNKDIHGNVFITLYIDHSKQEFSDQLYLFYNPTPQSIMIGSNLNNGFQGFLYNLDIYSGTKTDIAVKTLADYLKRLPIWNCGYGFFFKDNCKPCDSECETCVRTGDCILCKDMKCKTCESFTSNCSSCMANSILNTTSGSCNCPDYTYWNQSTAYCETCPDLCKTCINSTQCSICVDNSKLFNGSCECNLRFYRLNSTICSSCDVTCMRCDDFQEKNCTDCVIHASLTVEKKCICNSGYYRTGFNCSSCFERCETCNGTASNQCLSCKANLLLENSTCQCFSKSYWDQSMFYCVGCEETCSECSGRNYFQCLKCFQEDKILAGFCTEVCPLGYLSSDGKCLEKSERKAYVRFRFKEITRVFIDEVSKVKAITGVSEKFYLQAEEYDPIPAYERGLYFTGNQSFLQFTSLHKQVLFGPSFCFSFWILPEINDFLIFQYFYNETLNFNYSFEDLKIRADFWIFNEKFYYESSIRADIKEWNHLLLIVDYGSSTDFQAKINKISSTRRSLTENPLKDYLNSSFFISSFNDSSNSFKGFLYSLEFYVKEPEIETLVYPGECPSCSVCLSDGSCISSCNLTSFRSQQKCSSCLENCTSGCRDDQSCNLCHDLHCLNCSNFEANSCTECTEGYQLINRSCIKCENQVFYDKTQKICTPCKGLCKTCLSEVKCLTCLNHSSITENFQCVCDFGYYLDKVCERQKFAALISIDFKNIAKILFTESLIQELKPEDFDVFIGSEIVKFEMKEKDRTEYYIVCDINRKLMQGDKLQIKFKNEIISVKNSLLLTESLTISMFFEKESTLQGAIEGAKSVAGVAASVAIGSSIGSAALMSDPSFLFSTLTNVEMYSYVAMYDFDFDPALLQFLNSIQVQSQVPNAVNYLITETNTKPLKQKFIDYGYESDLLLKNSGVNLTLLSIFVILMPIAFMVPNTKYSFINSKVSELKQAYRYRIFIRIFIQSFFEICINSLIGITTFKKRSSLKIVDMTISCIFLVIIIQGIQIFLSLYLVLLILKKKNLFGEELKKFLQMYETFFSEFKESSTQGFYYLMFIARRLTIAILVIFADHPALQTSVSSVFSMGILVYIIGAKPYTNKIIQLYTLLSELLLLSFYIFLLLPFISDLTFKKESLTLKCIYIIMGALLINVIFAFLLTFNKILTWINERRAKKNLAIVTNYNDVSIQQRINSEDFFKKNVTPE